MKNEVIKEVEILKYEYCARLENGIVIGINSDGSADGTDGKTYYNIFQEVDGELEPVGWSCETDSPEIIGEKDCLPCNQCRLSAENH